MHATLLTKAQTALAQIEPMAAQGWGPAESIARQLRWCAAFAADEPREERPGPFSMELIATREFDMYGDRPELASLINEVQRETSFARPARMKIEVTREAVCLADDQLEPLELTLELGAEATLEDFADALASGFLHFSSTCRVLVGRSDKMPLLKVGSRWGSLAVEYLRPADTKLAAAVADAAVDFCFERAPILRPASGDLERRRPVWLALSDLFLDTDVNLLREGNTRLLAASAYSLDELDAILREEVYPACSFNLSVPTGEWAGFDAAWLERRILRGGDPPRPWWRRLRRYLTLGWSLPVRLPDEWPGWREDVARLRREAPAASIPNSAG